LPAAFLAPFLTAFLKQFLHDWKGGPITPLDKRIAPAVAAMYIRSSAVIDAHPSETEDNMDAPRVIEALNKAVALENAAMLQYKQHALLVRGLWRRVFTEFFSSESHSALDHARKFGQKIVALGGVPTVEVGATVRQSLDVEEMLRQDLDLERQAMQAYLAALGLAQDDVALRNMLEDQIEQEQRDIEELELYLDMVQTGAVAREVNLRVV
jgi:bacterioferritin